MFKSSQVVLALMYYLFHIKVGQGRATTTHTHLLLNRVHQFHASFFTSHVIIYKLLNRRVTDPSGAHVSPCLVVKIRFVDLFRFLFSLLSLLALAALARTSTHTPFSVSRT